MKHLRVRISIVLITLFLLSSNMLVSAQNTNIYETTERLYRLEKAEEHTTVVINAGGSVAQTFVAQKEWDMFEVVCPSFGNNRGSLTLSIFKWNENYEKTISGNAIVVKDFVDFADNQKLFVIFESPQESGEYLFLLDNARGDKVGVWKFKNSSYEGIAFQNGKEVFGDYEACVYYVTETGGIVSGDIKVPDEFMTQNNGEEISNQIILLSCIGGILAIIDVALGISIILGKRSSQKVSENG